MKQFLADIVPYDSVVHYYIETTVERMHAFLYKYTLSARPIKCIHA
jgi:hypothetical protein